MLGQKLHSLPPPLHFGEVQQALWPLRELGVAAGGDTVLPSSSSLQMFKAGGEKLAQSTLLLEERFLGGRGTTCSLGE